MLSRLGSTIQRSFATRMPSAAPEFKPFSIALIQLGGVTSNKENNLQHAREMITKAAQGKEGKKPHMIVLPECFNSPYGANHFPQYAEYINFKQGQSYSVAESKSPSVKMLSAMAKETGTWLLGGSIPEREDSPEGEKLYNTSTVYDPQGNLIATHRKVHLFDIDIPGKIRFKESETLSAGNNSTYFDTEFARIGLGICYDIRFPELTMIAARQGCHMMIYPSAFNLTTGALHWELLHRSRAVDNQMFISVCSPARDMTADYNAWGHSMVVDPMGKVLVEADHEETILFTDIVPAEMASARAGIPVSTQRRFDVYPNVFAGSEK